jgi:hypothetical protein
MIDSLRQTLLAGHRRTWALAAATLLGAAILGFRASTWWLALLGTAAGALVLLHQPILGLLAVVPAALIVPVEFGTGTAVALNPATMLVPALLGLWVLDMLRRQELCLAPSRANRPLFLFLLGGLFSLFAGAMLWDPLVPRPEGFIGVQLAQWAILAFSAGVFWLTANLVRSEAWLWRLTIIFLVLADGLAILRLLPGVAALSNRVATSALNRAPFWLLLTSLAGGQLLFNRRLSASWRLFLVAGLGAASVYSFYLERATVSNWSGVAAALAVLGWLRWPRLRWPVIILLAVLAGTGFLGSAVYEFAGGEAEWVESGGSRLALIRHVIEPTMRNPITGLGPAAYRVYAMMTPLRYRGAYYLRPWVSSHNNYVDLFSHVGLLGLGLFFWFAVELTRLGLSLRTHFTDGFAAGYVNGMLAAGAGALTLMLFADWILPFVYNIGFPGFQASVLVWLFLGGLVALEQMAS